MAKRYIKREWDELPVWYRNRIINQSVKIAQPTIINKAMALQRKRHYKDETAIRIADNWYWKNIYPKKVKIRRK